MKDVMVTIKFRESEINILYKALLYQIRELKMESPHLMIDAEIGDGLFELRDALKKIRQRIHDEKQKAKQEHKEG